MPICKAASQAANSCKPREAKFTPSELTLPQTLNPKSLNPTFRTDSSNLHTLHSWLRVATWPIWGFPIIRGTFLGVPIIRTIVFWGL